MIGYPSDEQGYLDLLSDWLLNSILDRSKYNPKERDQGIIQ